jgi:hypothetical protein
MVIGVNTTKDAIIFAETDFSKSEFTVNKILKIQFQIQQASDLYDLLQNITTIFGQNAGVTSGIALLKCPGGQYGASVEAIKAEAIVELSAYQMKIPINMVATQSLKKVLECEKNEKWQDKSKAMFNADGLHKYWLQGANGAACAAYKISKK